MARDIYPQWFRMRLVMELANTFSRQAFETPVIAGPERYYIMNILKAYWIITAADGTTLVTAKSSGHTLQVTRDQQSAILPDDNDDIIFVAQNEFTTLTSGAVLNKWSMIDLSDGHKHGILVADREIWLNLDADSDSTTIATARVWFLYTLVHVSAQELLDMLQED